MSFQFSEDRRGELAKLALFLLVPLAGCAVFSEHSELPNKAPLSWSQPGGAQQVSADWWKAFGDPTLTSLVAQALESNSDLRIAQERVNQARALAAVQHGAELPTLEVGATGGRADAVSPVSRRPFLATSHQEQFQASYEVDVWGRFGSLTQAAKDRVRSGQASRDAVALSVAAATASAYINLLALDERLLLARHTLNSREAAVSFAKARQAHGYASKLELAQAESEYRATAVVVPQLELAVSRAEHAICLLLGRAPGAVERGSALGRLVSPDLPATGIPSEFVRRRPDIAAAEALVAATDAQLAASRAQLLPSLRLTAALGGTGSSVYTGDPFKIWSLGGSVLAPIFEGGRLRAQVELSKSQRSEALHNYEKSVLTAFSEVEDQLSTVTSTSQQQMELDAQRASTQEALRIAQNRFRAGYSTYLEVLDAQRTLFLTEQQAVQIRADILVANVNLFKALGGGWQPDSPPRAR
ncbi:efflux transporter outer membrane subunit [Roseateles noduli]|uniref:efflux transporter outer membrane subunit n=1 Tax=Roseateles noduli TaxID=2052484 RepID=UPI003D65C395